MAVQRRANGLSSFPPLSLSLADRGGGGEWSGSLLRWVGRDAGSAQEGGRKEGRKVRVLSLPPSHNLTSFSLITECWNSSANERSCLVTWFLHYLNPMESSVLPTFAQFSWFNMNIFDISPNLAYTALPLCQTPRSTYVQEWDTRQKIHWKRGRDVSSRFPRGIFSFMAPTEWRARSLLLPCLAVWMEEKKERAFRMGSLQGGAIRPKKRGAASGIKTWLLRFQSDAKMHKKFGLKGNLTPWISKWCKFVSKNPSDPNWRHPRFDKSVSH